MFELAEMSDSELVMALRRTEQVIAAANAEQIAVIAELHLRAPDWLTAADPSCPGVHPVDVTAAEVGPALRISRLSATNRVDLALTVTSRLPATLAALEDGAISMTKVRRIVEATAALNDECAAEVEARVLPRAGEQTPAGFGVSLARAVISCDPAAAEERRLLAMRERRVDVFPGQDGMATLRALLPAAQALAAYRNLSNAAEQAALPGDTRSADARRADTLVDVLWHLGDADTRHDDAEVEPGHAEPRRRPRWGSKPVTVHVTVPLTTLAGLDQQPAHLAGFGPITADAARELAADGTWRRLVTDPLTGTLLNVGRTTYSPPSGLADHIRTRDGTCRFPCCRQPAGRTDLDHTVAYPEGPTAADNLAALCRGHHRQKTLTRWRVSQDAVGVLTWTSPTGQSYTTHPWQAYEPESKDGDQIDQTDQCPIGREPDWPELTDAEYDAQFERQLSHDVMTDDAADPPGEDEQAA